MTRRLFAVALCLLLVMSCTREPKTLIVGISTEEPGPSVAGAMLPLLAEVGINIVIEPNDDPESILTAILQGQADLGIVEEPARRIPGLTTVAPLYPSILHVMHRKGRSVSTFADLIQGQQIYAGPIGGTAWRLLQQLADDYMLETADYTILADPWRIEPDVFFILGGFLAAESLAQLGDYEMFSFGSADRLGFGTQAEGLALRYPNIRPFILPDAVYGSFNTGPILTLATRTNFGRKR